MDTQYSLDIITNIFGYQHRWCSSCDVCAFSRVSSMMICMMLHVPAIHIQHQNRSTYINRANPVMTLFYYNQVARDQIIAISVLDSITETNTGYRPTHTNPSSYRCTYVLGCQDHDIESPSCGMAFVGDGHSKKSSLIPTNLI